MLMIMIDECGETCKEDVVLQNLYGGTEGSISLMKSRRMRWAGHVAQVVDEECLKNFGREI
jgi:hypothetical protein